MFQSSRRSSPRWASTTTFCHQSERLPSPTPKIGSRFFAFLITATIASELSARAQHESINAVERRKDVERLYAFSQKLLTSDNVVELLNLLPNYVVDAFDVKTAAIALPDRQTSTGQALIPAM